MSDLISMNAVLELAVQQGASTTWKNFREAADEDAVIQSTIVRVPQGAKREVNYVPREIGVAFAAKYAQMHPKKSPITQPAPAPHQMTLPLDETRLERIESVLAMMHSENCARLKTLEIAVQKLAAMWESLEDDNK